MAGIIQDVELRLASAATARFRAELEAEARNVAETVARGINTSRVPQAARDAATKAVEALEQTFRSKTGELQALVSQGLLSAGAARRQGKIAADDYIVGIRQALQRAGIQEIAGIPLERFTKDLASRTSALLDVSGPIKRT
ncbi:MAG TPA: hypothetical protein VEB59_02480, partial [Gemmatimonadales bacterium]|nr:hypothetical protein [Gemmatimonadales bacterium]